MIVRQAPVPGLDQVPIRIPHVGDAVDVRQAVRSVVCVYALVVVVLLRQPVAHGVIRVVEVFAGGLVRRGQAVQGIVFVLNGDLAHLRRRRGRGRRGGRERILHVQPGGVLPLPIIPPSEAEAPT
jgi:hypothetical protein